MHGQYPGVLKHPVAWSHSIDIDKMLKPLIVLLNEPSKSRISALGVWGAWTTFLLWSRIPFPLHPLPSLFFLLHLSISHLFLFLHPSASLSFVVGIDLRSFLRTLGECLTELQP